MSVDGSLSVGGKVPVLVLSGFLGAGKSTLLRHLLGHRHLKEHRVALVINDVGSVNVDASLVDRDGCMWDELVALTDGCICCSLQEELVEALLRLSSQAYDLILVESTGMSDPKSVVQAFFSRDALGRCPAEWASLWALVTVVGADSFLEGWEGLEKRRRSQAQGAAQDDALFDLMLSQVECADLVLLNKTDLINEEEQSQLLSMLHGLNPGAMIFPTQGSQIEPSWLFDVRRFDLQQTTEAAGWLQALEEHQKSESHREAEYHDHHHDHSHETLLERYALQSFVYEARHPFELQRLIELFRDGWEGLLRAKGFVWLAQRREQVYFFSLVGKTHTFEPMGHWWSTRIESGELGFESLPYVVRQMWDDTTGDRRQELVFLGVSIDEARLRAALDRCLKR